MVRKFSILILIISLAGMINSCGFHFIGRYKLPEYLNQLVIYPLDDSKSDFYVNLKNTLENQGVQIIPLHVIQDLKLKNNLSILHISIPIIKEKIHSYNSQGQITTNMLTASCEYKLFDHANNLLQKNIIHRNRSYAINNNQLLSSAGERQLIVKELQLEIINELLRQLSVDVRRMKKA